jgi:flagellar basal body-associated protein FliL
MNETDKKRERPDNLRWLKFLIILLILTVTSMMSYFLISSLKKEPANKDLIINSITVLPAQDNGTIALEPFVVVCRNENPGKSKILIADIKLSFLPEQQPDVMARMFEIRSAILNKLQNEGSELRKDQAEITLNKTLKSYNIQKVTISRYDLK